MKQFIVWCAKEHQWICFGSMHERLAKLCAKSLQSEGYEVRVVPKESLSTQDIVEA
jgi:hypothetical protein